MFFEEFFSQRGEFETKANGEANVLCPFPHNKGYETRPSAHVHVEKKVFHCKTCQAEGRFQDGGLSEIGFIAEYFGMGYEDAIQFHANFDGKSDVAWEQWSRLKDMLYANTDLMEMLQSYRGFTLDTIKEYNLGFRGDGVAYPITIYDQLCDVRTYYRDGIPAKIVSEKGGKPLLFPFDHWVKDDRPTLLCAGENDTLLARQNGFNALTITAGEGAFPKMFASHFTGKDVYICYDCDEAGKRGALTVAFYLHEAKARVYLVDLGLIGTKEDKDITDFFLKHGRSSSDLLQLIQKARKYDDDAFVQEKNKRYPLVNLWDVPNGEYEGRYMSSRVVVSGKYDQPMRVPTAIHWQCRRPIDGNPICEECPLKNQDGWWTAENQQLRDVTYLAEANEGPQTKAIRSRMVPLPEGCPNGTWEVKARQSLYKIVFTPDTETEDESSGFRAAEQYAYVIKYNLEDGQRYRVYFRSYSHPLDGQRVYMVVDRVEASDNAINAFQMNPQIYEELKVFQGDPTEVMNDRAARLHAITILFKPNPMIAHIVDIMYHSPLRFKFRNREMKGYPEVLIVGESRVGKTESALLFQRYIGVGNFMPLKGATTAGLLGGADKLPSGGHKITWGTIPRNHKGLVIMDELSGMSREVMSSLTSARSERIATVHKIVKGKAPAETRLYWTANPRTQSNGQSMNVRDYPTGVQIVLDLIGSDEDVARFDACYIAIKDHNSSPLDVPEKEAHPASTYRNLVYWVWSRTSDQIIFEKGVEEYIVQVAEELNEKYDTDVKFFGAEAWKKLARIAVACAGACFSTTDDGTAIVIRKPHVDWAANFLTRCYDNSIFRLAEYVRERRSYNETNEAANNVVAGICRNYPIVVKTLLNAMSPVPMGNLRAVSGLEGQGQEFSKLLNSLSQNFLVHISSSGVLATRRFRMAVDVYKGNYYKSKMIPLSEQ